MNSLDFLKQAQLADNLGYFRLADQLYKKASRTITASAFDRALFEALEKIKPSISLKFYKQSYKKNKTKIKAIPYPLMISQQYKKSLYWFFKSIQKKTDKSFTLKIVSELYKINLYNLSDAILKKYEYYKYATLFKTSSRFKW